MRGNIKRTMYKIFTMLLVIFIQTTGIYAFNASETSQSNQTEKQSTNMELVVNNTSTSEAVESGYDLKYTITVANPNEIAMTNVKFEINLDADDTTGAIKQLVVKDKTGNNISANDVVRIEDNILNIINLPANDEYTIEYYVRMVSLFNDDSDITNSLTLLSSDNNLTLSADSVLSCNISKRKQLNVGRAYMESQIDGKFLPGETIRYAVLINSGNRTAPQSNLHIRDSMLENIPSFVTYNRDLRFVDRSSAIIYEGSLEEGDFVIKHLPASTYLEYSYSIRINTIPAFAETMTSVVTYDGSNPNDPDTGLPVVCTLESRNCTFAYNYICDLQRQNTEYKNIDWNEMNWEEICYPKIDPAIPVTDPMKAKTEIYKSLTESNPDGIADIGETLKYKIEVVNNGTVPAYNTIIRDSMLENLPSYVTFNEDIKITTDIQTTGDLTSGDYTITSIPASSTATITYSITVDELPNNVAKLTNIATKGGSDPDICLGDVEKCSEVILPLKPIEITEENKKEPTSETSVNTEDSIEPKSSIETTLTEQPTVMKKLTTTGGLGVIATIFLAVSGMFLVTLKRVA